MTRNGGIFLAAVTTGLVLLSGCGAIKNTKNSDVLDQVGRAVGIDVSDGVLLSKQDSHGSDSWVPILVLVDPFKRDGGG